MSIANTAQTVLLSHCIFDGTGRAPFDGYVAVADGRILAVGAGPCPESLVTSETELIDLCNKTVSAGYTDVHCFFTGYTMGFVGVDLSKVASCEEILAAVKAYAETLSAGKPVLGHGWNSKVLHPAGPHALDEAFGSRPVILFAAGGETCWMNTAAQKAYHFTPETCWPESYAELLPVVLGDRAYIEPEFRRYMQLMNSRGVTSVKEMGFDDYDGFTDVLADLEKDNALTLRVSFMTQPVRRNADLPYARAMRDKFKGEFVHFSGFNRMTDGSISQLCGDLKKPYNCAPDTTCAQEIDWKLIGDETRAVDAEGFRFSLHAQGDAAISKVLDIYETCHRDEHGRVINRHSITDLEFSDPADLERMGKLGVIAEIYPQIQSIADRAGKLAMIEEKIGMERGKYYWNRRKMADSGVLLSCGTDLPLLIDDIPQSVYHAVGGYFPEGGEPFNKQNMLTVPELMTAWTRGGAYNLGQEKELGTLEAGKKADIAVLSGNIFTIPVEDARSLAVVLTMVGGKIVYQAD